MSQPKVSEGTVYLMVAQGTFLVSSYIMHIVLGRYLGPAEYGLFGVVLYSAAMIRTLSESGLCRAVVRYISAEPERAEEIFRKGLMLQLILAALISLSFFLAAPVLARLLGDKNLISLFRIMTPIIIFSGIFMLIIQYYNGLFRYASQSVWLAVYYLVRAGLVVSLTVVGLGVFGAVTGLVAASGIVAFFIFITRTPGESKESFPASTLIRFSVPLIISSIAGVLVANLDLMFVTRLVPSAFSTGHYTSAKALTQAPLFVFYALSSALYPAVSNAFSNENWIRLKKYIHQAHRLLLMVLLPPIIFISCDSAEIITLFYGIDYVEGAPALRWLIFSSSILAILVIHQTIITGCGFPKISSLLTLSLLPICVVLHLTLIPVFGLVGAAVASALTFMIGACCSLTILYVKFKAGFHLTSTLRILGAASLMFVLDVVLTWLGLSLIPKLTVLTVFFLIVLGAFGELRRSELRELVEHFQKVGGKKANGAA